MMTLWQLWRIHRAKRAIRRQQRAVLTRFDSDAYARAHSLPDPQARIIDIDWYRDPPFFKRHSVRVNADGVRVLGESDESNRA